jgi:uncharacterized protein YdeI (BOF family)
LKKTILLILLAALVPVACARHKGGANSQAGTQTIAPANPQPASDSSGTDAMTQTVLVDDSRSEADGMASASTSTAPAAKKGPAKKKGKK